MFTLAIYAASALPVAMVTRLHDVTSQTRGGAVTLQRGRGGKSVPFQIFY